MKSFSISAPLEAHHTKFRKRQVNGRTGKAQASRSWNSCLGPSVSFMKGTEIVYCVVLFCVLLIRAHSTSWVGREGSERRKHAVQMLRSEDSLLKISDSNFVPRHLSQVKYSHLVI